MEAPLQPSKRQHSEKTELAAQTNHPRVLFFFFIISPDAAHQIPPAGLRHRDPGEWSGLSTILFSRFHINKVFCSRRGLQKNHNAAEFSLVLFKTNRILTGSFLGPLITPEACTPPPPLPHPYLNEVMMEEITDGFLLPENAHAGHLMPGGRIMLTPTCGVVAAYLQSD